MEINIRYVKWAYRYFGRLTENYFAQIVLDIKPELKRSGVFITAYEYIATALATAALVFLFTTPSLSVIISLLLIVGGSAAVSSFALGSVIGLIAGTLLSVGIFALFYIYPSLLVGEQKKQTLGTLPFALLYLETLVASGMPLTGMFKTLAKFKEFGEFARESKRIVDESQIAGISLAEAIANAAKRTSAEELKDIFWGIRSTITVGGDLRLFIHEHAKTAMYDYKRSLEQFTKRLTLMVEMYITLVIVGSVIFTVLTTIISGLGGGNVALTVVFQMLVTFVFLPLASFGFYIIVKGIAPANV